jgi:two-component system, chemotaxis family, CheB/CheR fusion protein
MPQNAIEAGVADAVLPAEAMAGMVTALAQEVMEKIGRDSAGSPGFDEGLLAVLDIIRARAGHDFRCYKPTTLVRRIRRRMTLSKSRVL